MTSEVGSGQVAIFPTLKGFRKAVSREVDGTTADSGRRFSRGFARAGRDAGDGAGRGFKQAFQRGSAGVSDGTLKQLTADVAATSKTLSAARLKEQDAAGRLRVAETRPPRGAGPVRGGVVAGDRRRGAARVRAAEPHHGPGHHPGRCRAPHRREGCADRGHRVGDEGDAEGPRRLRDDVLRLPVGLRRLPCRRVRLHRRRWRPGRARPSGARPARDSVQRVRLAATSSAQGVTDFIAGFRDGDAAASRFHRRPRHPRRARPRLLSPLGRVGQAVADSVTTPFLQLAAGFRDATVGATGFLGIMGRVGAVTRQALDGGDRGRSPLRRGHRRTVPELHRRPHRLVGGASAFTGRLGTAGGVVARSAGASARR